MGTIKIPATYDTNSVLLADDEPEHLEWLVEYLEAKGKNVTIATNVREALEISETRWFRVYIVDLNIPLGGWPESTRAMYINYPGLAIIEAIRSQGNDGRRVIAYSAHLNDSINSEMRRLYTDYLAKGRPIQLKERLQELWQLPDLTAASLERRAALEARRAASAAEKTKSRPFKSPKSSQQSKKTTSSTRTGRPTAMATQANSPPKKRRSAPAPSHGVQKAGSLRHKRRSGA
jgi:CheY-like chemotaxis protein